MSTKVRTNTRLEVTSEQAAFIKKAVKAQADQLEALTEWPAIIPYSKEYVLKQHSEILSNLEDLSKPLPVKTRTRTPKVEAVPASAKNSTAGATRQANA